MKALALIIGMWLANYPILWAQDATYIKIKAESDLAKAISVSDKYQYSAFKSGRVVFITGALSEAKLNYNTLLGEIHFIDPKGDTLSMANEYTLKQITIETDTFYYFPKHGYLQVVGYYKPVKLAGQQKLVMVKSEKMAAYGQSSAVSSIKQCSTFTNQNGQLKKLDTKGDILVTKQKLLFLIDQNNNTKVVNTANILKIYSSRKNQITQYVKENAINFQKEADVKKLLEFCSHTLD